MRNPPQRPVVAAFACALLDVPRVRDQAGRVREHLAGERELVGPGLPDRCHAAVENTVREQATGNACVTLHRCEVAGPVLVADRQAGDEMVQNEVVQDDDARAAAQRLHDPAVRLGIVADVIERDVRRDRPRPATADDLDIDEPAERRQQERGVIGDARPLRRERRVERDLHWSRRAIVSSQETRRAISLPA